MRGQKVIAMVGSLLILGTGLVFAQNGSAQGIQDKTQLKNAQRPADAPRAFRLFLDENGDGICDLDRDHDLDGIPNLQDPDWTGPEDGSGLMNRYGRNDVQPSRFRAGLRSGLGFSNRTFRNQMGSFGNNGGVCPAGGGQGQNSSGRKNGKR